MRQKRVTESETTTTGFGGPRDDSLQYALAAASTSFCRHFSVQASLQ